jgi:hypothetical protein
MGEERDKNIRHPRPAHVVMALFCSPNSQLSRDFFLILASQIFLIKNKFDRHFKRSISISC